MYDKIHYKKKKKRCVVITGETLRGRTRARGSKPTGPRGILLEREPEVTSGD